MIPEKLAKEKDVTVKDFDDAVGLLNTDFLVQHHGTDLKEILISARGTLRTNIGEYPCTDWAFESLCKIIKMPSDFARRIPPELFIENFNTLKEKYNCRLHIYISRDTVINLDQSEHAPLGNIELIANVRPIFDIAGLELHELRLSDRGVEISVLHNNSILEPLPRDITTIGMNILSSETGFRGTKGSLYLLRQVCTNGATVSNNWGTVEWSYDYRISHDKSVRNFLEGIQKLQLDYERFSSAYSRLTEREIVAFEFVNLHRSVARTVRNMDKADSIFHVTKEDRNRLNHEVREGNRLISTGINAYELHNNITHAAKGFNFVQRRSLERIGGAMVDMTLLTSGIN